jgi:hypothetical protein
VYIRKYTANIVQSQQNTKYNNYNNTEQQILTLSLYHVWNTVGYATMNNATMNTFYH